MLIGSFMVLTVGIILLLRDRRDDARFILSYLGIVFGGIALLKVYAAVLDSPSAAGLLTEASGFGLSGVICWTLFRAFETE